MTTKININNSNTSFAWRLLAVDSSQAKASSLSEAQQFQLRGIFLHFDEDRDGLLTTDQLATALSELGFQPRERLLKHFCVNPTQMKVEGRVSLSFKTDCKTFLSGIQRELDLLKITASELDSLFSFVDVNGTGFLSKKELRYLLVDLESPTRLSAQEFQRFVRSLTFASDTDSISIAQLKRQLLFYQF